MPMRPAPSFLEWWLAIIEVLQILRRCQAPKCEVLKVFRKVRNEVTRVFEAHAAGVQRLIV
jgi:hypothetical protein